MCIHVKQDGFDTMQQREHSKQKSSSCEASSTDGEQFDRDNTDCLQLTLSLNTLLSRIIPKESSIASRFFQRLP